MNVDLSNYLEKGSKVFSGRVKGEKLRKKLKLDINDNEKETVTIKIPKYVYSFNSSYFLGLFSPSIEKLGEEGFREKYRFDCSEIIMEDIYEGIMRAIKLK